MKIPLLLVVLSIIQIFGMFGIGLIAKHYKYFAEEDLNKMSHFTVDCLMPFLIFHAIVTSFDSNKSTNMILLPLIGFAIIIIGVLLGFLFKKGLKSKDLNVIKTFHHFCGINNFRYLPIIIVQNIFGESMLANLFFLNLGSQIALWTVGVAILGEKDLKKTIKNLLSPSIIALFLAIIFGAFGLTNFIPQVMMNIFKMTGQAAIPLILILIGASLHRVNMKDYYRDLIYLFFVRLVIIPCFIIWFLKMVPMSENIYILSAIIALMPVASSTAVFTRRFGGSPEFAAAGAVVTHVGAILTVPVGLLIIN